MGRSTPAWSILVYRIPTQPTRLRLLIWRKLQAMGALCLQDAVYLLPARPELDENMQYIAAQIEEMGGSCYLFAASTLLPDSTERLIEEFRSQADDRFDELIQRLDRLGASLAAADSPGALEQVEQELKRERIAYLRAQRLTFFGSAREAAVAARFEEIRRSIDELSRSAK